MGETTSAFGLGWFLGRLGFKKIAIGDTKGQIGTDWHPLEVEKIETEILRRRLSGHKGGNAFLELLTFAEQGEGFSFKPPSFRNCKENSLVTMTCAIYVKKMGKIFVVCRCENGQNKNGTKYFTVDDLKKMAGLIDSPVIQRKVP